MKKTLMLVVSLVLLLGMFTGCDMAMDTSALSSRGVKMDSPLDSERALKNTKPVSFTASVQLFQDFTSVVTLDMGNSNHHKTIEETLYSYMDLGPYGQYGGMVSSDWDLLDGKLVVMSNVTNYNLDEATTEIGGSNHSVINIVDPATGEVVATLDANGTVNGSLFGAEIAMNWVMKENSAGVNARGKVDGIFTWYVIDPNTGAPNPNYIPNGNFVLSGTYK
ncbi:hypothetical protein [Sphaerochaeta sp. S2]|uniref:hypothetical protein n=1 Tax=Sphaerochaeta sp. S2 TaxID=2798868 RepID=UPI001E633EA8|nr:hypothetical protein [Sphaerochaeta sp. S2]MCK9348285.1 hypothetical protein [Sphaerochaeta sp.]